jgi:hypothetical protein
MDRVDTLQAFASSRSLYRVWVVRRFPGSDKSVLYNCIPLDNSNEISYWAGFLGPDILFFFLKEP